MVVVLLVFNIFNFNYSKYKFKCLLTKDPSETTSLEYRYNKGRLTLVFVFTILNISFTF